MTTTITVNINGTLVSIKEGSPSINDAINKRSTCSFTVVDTAGTAVYEDGTPVEVLDGSTTIFKGFVLSGVKTRLLSGRGSTRLHNITAGDFHQILEGITVAGGWENKDASEIVSDLITSYFSTEGITAGTLATGVTVTQCVFKAGTFGAAAMDELATRAGYMWYLNWDLSLDFIPREANAAPWTVTADDIMEGSLVLETGNSKYRNKEMITNAKRLTSTQTEQRKGDGTNQVFVMSYELAKEPIISVGEVSKTVGIQGVDEDKDWYWNEGSKDITQDKEGTPLTSSQILTVVYVGSVDMIITIWNGAEMERRATITGVGTGTVTSVDNAPGGMTDVDGYFEYANALLNKYGDADPKRATFTTTRPGLEAGQLVTMDTTLVSGELLIESVKITMDTVVEAGVGKQRLKYAVTAIEGPIGETWTMYFKDLVDRTRAISVGINAGSSEMAVVTKNYTETVGVTDICTITIHPGPVYYAVGDVNAWRYRAVDDPLAKKVC